MHIRFLHSGSVFTSQKVKRRKLAVQFILFLGVTIFFLFSLLTYIATTSVRSGVTSSYRDSSIEIVSARAKEISNWAQNYVSKLSAYTTADIVKSGDQKQIAAWLLQHKSIRPEGFEDTFFCAADGKLYNDKGNTTTIANKDYFKAVMEKGKDFYISDLSTSRLTGKPVINIVKGVYDNAGKVFGFFGATVGVSELQAAISSIKIGKSGYAFMLGSDGTVIAHPVQDYVLNKNFTDIATKDHQDMELVAKDMVARKSGSGFVNGLTSKKDLVTYSPVPDTPWSLAVSIPDEQVYATSNRLQNIIFVSCFVIAAVLLVLSGIMMYAALRPLQKVEKTITGIASGTADLTQRIRVVSNNEIGAVVIGFNSFEEKLQSIISDIKKSKSGLSSIDAKLQTGTEHTSAAITQIIANIEEVNSQISGQTGDVEETTGAVTEISRNIASLEKMIENQSAKVVQASTAVEEMISNIGSVDRSMEQMALSFDALRGDVQSGSAKQQNVNERIGQIKDQSETLQTANAVISNIAIQTNLLAMNASIEAAHAGAAGKGFSVVADEIRKLSETSSVQSKTIGEQLGKIESSIRKVVSASVESGSVFVSVAEKIKETDTLVQQIKNAMEEQQKGGQQIENALGSMNDCTTEVRTASAEMSAGNTAILEKVRDLQEATLAIKSSTSEMRTGAEKIKETGTALADVSFEMKDSIDRIGNQIDQFKT